ncbi:hypothetical protein [Acrocarpospora sp. B8E8]|uniref:hypothetical protein n=1 Tax=Acrocarpospora sp. B8E8 TaxID=3153572 RepID=UPI00325EDDAF
MGIDVNAGHVAALRDHGPGWALAWDGDQVRIVEVADTDDATLLEIGTGHTLQANADLHRANGDPCDDEVLAGDLAAIAGDYLQEWPDLRELMPLTAPLTRALTTFTIIRSGMGIIAHTPVGREMLVHYRAAGDGHAPGLIIAVTVSGPGDPVGITAELPGGISRGTLTVPADTPAEAMADLIDALARTATITPTAPVPA